MLLPRLSALLLLLLCFLRPAAAAPLGLTLLPGPETVITGSKSAQYAFAPRPLSEEAPLTHTFYLHNATTRAQTIERVAVSCDCVQVEISETQSLPVKIKPGQTVPVRLLLALRRLTPGPVSKSAWLYLSRADRAGICLEMHGIILDTSAQDPSSTQK